MRIPESEWLWFGRAAHLIVGRYCRFHMTTLVGPWLISTVGAYVHPRHGHGREDTENQWLRENHPGEDIGFDRKFETFVFRSETLCSMEGCDCGLPIHDGGEVDTAAYNLDADATKGHRAMCDKWASIETEIDPAAGIPA